MMVERSQIDQLIDEMVDSAQPSASTWRLNRRGCAQQEQVVGRSARSSKSISNII